MNIPTQLQIVLGTEPPDFVIKAGRALPLSESLIYIVFGIIWTTIAGIIMYGPLPMSSLTKDLQFRVNGVPVDMESSGAFQMLIEILVHVPILVGLGIFIWGGYSLFRTGGYFVGTPTRLIRYRNKQVKSIDWEQFSGNIDVSGTEQKGNISLQMRTGKIVAVRHRRDRYVPDMIYISDIPNVFAIAELCKRRIKENDPTPAHKQNTV